ncbi:fatty acid desaturase [Candidatus Uabimicrobium amorphum]|uniref:Fatty acid desaturase n=1 Tax=Uabimicrobium amorphum TaxID=2596890 RepID=A0A5S9IPZ6_UABAM|nr:fatty acid desaturase [Candidatus Uabimicrobium amorphum]BBM85948.1 fatty acid desaturase [Candidatus Uabimicrobium amorphum]
MDEKFYKSSDLTKEKLRQMLAKSNHPASVRFMIMYILFLVTSALVVVCWTRSWWELTIAFIGYAVVGCSLFACEHETVHNTAFKSRSLNRFAAFLCGIGHLYAPTAFRELHFTHHRHTHIPGKDPEISLGGKPAPSVVANLPMYLGWLSGFPLLLFKLNMLVSGTLGMPEFLRRMLFPFINQKVRKQLALESMFILGVHIGVVFFAIFVHPGFWGILIGQVIAHCVLANYLILEHNGLPHEGNILQKTRSIQTNRFIKLVMWNMPYHAEHHAYPGVPFHALPQLSREISNELVHKQDGHFRFHLKMLKGEFCMKE